MNLYHLLTLRDLCEEEISDWKVTKSKCLDIHANIIDKRILNLEGTLSAIDDEIKKLEESK